MLLPDDIDKDVARRYRISFDGFHIYAENLLKELLKNPIIISREEKKGIATDLLKKETFFTEDRTDLYHSSIIENTIENIRPVSEYVRIADTVRSVKRFDFPFIIGFIAKHLPDFDKTIQQLDDVSSNYVKLLVDNFGYHCFDDLRFLLYPYCNTTSLKEISKYITENQEQVLLLPEIILFRKAFARATLTEESTWLAPFSISRAEATSYYYEEAEREIIESAILEVQATDLLIKKLCFKPYKKKSIR